MTSHETPLVPFTTPNCAARYTPNDMYGKGDVFQEFQCVHVIFLCFLQRNVHPFKHDYYCIKKNTHTVVTSAVFFWVCRHACMNE